MLKRTQLTALGAAVLVLMVAGVAEARGTGGSGFSRSEAAPPAMMKPEQMKPMHDAMQAQRNAQPTYDGWLFVGGEAGWAQASQATISGRDARIAAPAAQPYGEVTADGWTFIGGEAGWLRAQHRFEFKGGKLVHAHEPWCVASHDLPAPSKSILPGQEQQWNLYPGA